MKSLIDPASHDVLMHELAAGLLNVADLVKLTGQEGSVTLDYRLSLVGGELAVSGKVTPHLPRPAVIPGQVTIDEVL